MSKEAIEVVSLTVTNPETAAKKTPSRSVSQEPPITVDLNILTQFIKKFDGNREQLNPFIINCKNALDLAAPWQKDILFKLILSKLEGKAQIACAIKELENWNQLEEFLKTQFGEKKHYAHLLSELQECKQLHNETANQFGLRVETCLARLISEINISIPTKRKMELSGRVAAMEDLALHTFVTGLNPKIATIVRCRNPENLNTAVNFAVAEEKISDSMSKRMTPSSSNNDHNRNRIPQPRPDAKNFNSGSKLFCRYCKTVGHVIENCRKREYNNNRFRNTDQQQPSGSGFKPQQKQFSRVHFISDTSDDEFQDNEGHDEVDSDSKNE